MKKFIYIFYVLLAIFSCTEDPLIPTNTGNLVPRTLSNITLSTTGRNIITSNFSISQSPNISVSEIGIQYSTGTSLSPTPSQVSGMVSSLNQSIAIPDLIPGQSYSFRPYARTLQGSNFTTIYGNTISTTLASLPSGLGTNLVAFYPMNGDFSDRSSTGNNLNLISGSLISSQGKSNGLNSSYLFQGNNALNRIGVTNPPSSACTIAFWMKPTGSVPLTAVNYGTGTLGAHWSTASVKITSANTITVSHWDNDFILNFQNLNLFDGAWYFVAWIYEAGKTEKIRLFRKSSAGNTLWEYSKPSGFVTLNFANNYNLTIGAFRKQANPNTFEQYFSGNIDDVWLYSRALTSAELDEIIYNY